MSKDDPKEAWAETRGGKTKATRRTPDLDSLPTIATSPAPRPPSLQLPPGALIAERYNILDTLGVGGMGVVYHAVDHVLELDVALKVLRPEMAHDEAFLQRFRHELLMARRVTHRHVVRIHDLGVHKGMPFMTMDLIEGQSLRAVIQERGALPLDEALKLFRQVAEALAEAHRQGVIHRDLKPENILIDGNGDALVTDFGVARSIETSGLTRTGEILGTPNYLSPEQARGEQVDGRSDIFTLGVIFLEMVSGKLPFSDGTLFEIIAQRMSGELDTPAELGIELPPEVSSIVDRCVTRLPAKRYQSAEALATDLRRLGRPGNRSLLKPLAWTLAALLLLAIGALVVPRWLPPEEDATALTEVESAPAVAPHLAIAALPLSVEAAAPDEDLDVLAAAVPAFLSRALIESDGVRVVDRVQLLGILRDLGHGPGALRRDEIPQLIRNLGVDQLIFGSLRRTDGEVEVELLASDGGEQRQIAVVRETAAGLEPLVGQLVARTREAFDLEPSAVTLKLPDGGAAAAYLAGLDALSRQQPADAIAAFERATEQDPGFARAWLDLAAAHRLSGRDDAALVAAQRAVESATDDGRTLAEAQALAALLSGQPEEAQHRLAGLVERYPFDPGTRLALAEAYGRQGNFPRAVAVLEEAARIDPGDARAWYQLGRYSIQSGNLQQAVDEYLVRALVRYKRLRDERGQGEVYNALGAGYQRLGLIDEALENYRSATEIRERIGDQRGLSASLYNLVTVHLMRGDFDTAAATIERALNLQQELGDPIGLARLYDARGLLEEERGRVDAALDAYRQALQVLGELGDERALAESHNNVGFAYYQLGEYDNAVLHFEKSLELYRRNDNPAGEMLARQSLGFCEIALGQWPRARDSFSVTLQQSGELGIKTATAVALGNLGLVAQYQGRYGEALAAYQDALEILTEIGDPRGQIEFLLHEAETRLEIGDLDGAEARLATVGELETDAVSREQQVTLSHLQVRRQLRRGDAGGARELLERRVGELGEKPESEALIHLELGLGLTALATDQTADALPRLESAMALANQRREAILQLRVAEALAGAQLADGDFAAAVRTLDAIQPVLDRADEYARSYHLLHLRAQSEAGRGRATAASNALAGARERLAEVRETLPSNLQPGFDELPEVAALRARG